MLYLATDGRIKVGHESLMVFLPVAALRGFVRFQQVMFPGSGLDHDCRTAASNEL
jgi:hypothetical protein